VTAEGVRGGPGDLQRRQLFGRDLAVDAASRGAQEPTAGEEDQGEARLTQPTVRVSDPPEETEGTEAMPATGKGTVLGSPGDLPQDCRAVADEAVEVLS
jgi:hypothetical protein